MIDQESTPDITIRTTMSKSEHRRSQKGRSQMKKEGRRGQGKKKGVHGAK